MKFPINNNVLLDALGFYFIFDKNFTIIKFGGNLEKIVPDILVEKTICKVFTFERPQVKWILNDIECLIKIPITLKVCSNSILFNGAIYQSDSQFIFVGYPLLLNAEDILSSNINMSDFAATNSFHYFFGTLQAKNMLIQDIQSQADILKASNEKILLESGLRKHAEVRLALVAEISAAIENLPVGFIMVTNDLNVHLFNQEFLSLYDLEPQQVFVGMPIVDLVEILSYKLKVESKSRLDIIKETLLFYEEKKTFQVERELLSGITIDIRGNAEEAVGFIITISDITYLKELQQKMIEIEKMAALGTLVAGIAHEVNTPIGICVTASSVMKDKTAILKNKYDKNTLSTTDFEEYINKSNQSLDIINSNLGRASVLVSSFKQISVDQHYEDKKTINLLAFIKESLVSLKHELKAGQHQVVFSGDDSIQVHVTPNQIWQIVSNLVLNSIRHAFLDITGGTILIKVEKISNGYVSLTIQDNGCGMSDEVINKCFEPFYTTSRGVGGSGLGLSIVHTLVTESLRGSLNVKKIEGGGVKFNLEFPIKCVMV